MHPLLSIERLSVDFLAESGTTTAIRDISIQVNRGEILALVGESGSGKSVTSLSILQLLPVPPARYSEGRILFSENGEAPVNLLEADTEMLRQLRGSRIAMIFQEPMTSLNPVLTCGQQVTEALLTHRSISSRQAKEMAISWFEKVKLPDPAGIFDRYPHQLSGGQKQRVMIAMAMCGEPALLICDEPTTALDVTVQKTILELIRELQQQLGMGVIFITHDLGVVAEIADRAAVMYRGEIVEEGSVRQLFQSPRHPYTRALLACRPARHPRGKRLPVVSDFLEPVNSIAQPAPLAAQAKPQAQGVKTEPLVRVEDLAVWFPSRKNFLGKPLQYVKAVDGVSFGVYKNETLGLVGESGCGKTTLGRALLRLIRPTSGNIYYDNREMGSFNKQELAALRKDIQIVFQDPYSSLNPRMTIGAAIAEPMKVHRLETSEKVRRDRVVELLEKVNLQAAHFNRYPHEFSGGQRQRIVIARALALHPSFVVCDESVSALDVSVQAQVLNLLNDLKREFGFTVVFISHDLAVVRYISDRILVMNRGKIEEIGTAEAIYENPTSPYTRSLIDAIPGKLAV